MAKLIRADISRMWKTRSFWVCGVLAVGAAVLWFILNYIQSDANADSIGYFMFDSVTSTMCCAAVFAALFIGADYANGTIRNKMAVGHGRCSIYFANFILSSIGGIIYLAASWAAVIVAGFCVGGNLGFKSYEQPALKIFISLFAVISACSIITIIGMLITSKSAAAVVSIAGFFVMTIGFGVLIDMLHTSEFYTVATLQINDEGEQEYKEERVRNNLYIASPMNEILQTVCDILPFGQAAQFGYGTLPEVMPLYSVGFTAAVSVVGVAVFRRKDLK